MDEASRMIPEGLDEAIDAAVPPGVTHIGFVATDDYGNVLVREPNGHPYGVSATLTRVKVKPSERPSETLERCLREQVGESAAGVFPIPVVWTTSQSSGFYFAGMLDSRSVSPTNLAGKTGWCEPSEAERRIGVSQNRESRQRDLGLLAAASSMCLSPDRRILLMVQELHRLGFERLRAPAYQYPIAWRCPIVPAYWTLQRHGGRYDDLSSQIEQLFGVTACEYTYSSACGQFPFGWDDMPFAMPSELARRFVRERREIACAGWGPDVAYARWFEQILEATKPNGLYYAFGEFEDEMDYLYTHMTKVERIPLPPPGWATEGEFPNHHEDSDFGNGEETP